MEEWRTIPEYPDHRVSNMGNLESKRSGEWKPRKLKRVNKGNKHGNRMYLGFNVPTDDRLPSGRLKTKTLLIHNEVAKLFIGPRPPGLNVLHKDDDRDRNMVDNLTYGTQSENVKNAWANGRMGTPTRGHRGQFTGSTRRYTPT